MVLLFPLLASDRYLFVIVTVYFIEEGQRGKEARLLQQFSNVTLVTPASTGPASSNPLDSLYSINFFMVMMEGGGGRRGWISNRDICIYLKCRYLYLQIEISVF